jgi:hypothetical protein
MKLFKAAIFCFCVVGFSTKANAQFWKKIQKKIEQKVEQKIEQKIDKEADKVIDSTLNGKKNRRGKEKPLSEIPKFTGGSGKLTFYNYGYEYTSDDASISVYGKFNTNNLSSSVKTYNEDRVIAPVDAFPEGYALASGKWGYLNPKGGQIIIHHADSTKVVFSVKGTWNTIDGKKPVAGSYVSLNVSEIVDKRVANTSNTSMISSSEKNTSTNNTNSVQTKSSNANADIAIPSTFSFNSSLEVKMTANNGTSADLEFLLGNYSGIYGMSIASAEMGEGGKVYNVVTPKSITMFMDVAGMKMKKTVAQEQFSQASFDDKMPSNPDDLIKTGATKSILGYTCYEYKYTNDGGYVSVWATKDFPVQATKIQMLGMREGGKIEGFILEIDSKSGNETANMKAVKFNKNKNITIHTNDYKSIGY